MGRFKQVCYEFKSVCIGIIVGISFCSFQSYILGEDFDNCLLGYIQKTITDTTTGDL